MELGVQFVIINLSWIFLILRGMLNIKFLELEFLILNQELISPDLLSFMDTVLQCHIFIVTF